jgi:hypothetical protein
MRKKYGKKKIFFAYFKSMENGVGSGSRSGAGSGTGSISQTCGIGSGSSTVIPTYNPDTMFLREKMLIQ